MYMLDLLQCKLVKLSVKSVVIVIENKFLVHVLCLKQYIKRRFEENENLKHATLVNYFQKCKPLNYKDTT